MSSPRRAMYAALSASALVVLSLAGCGIPMNPNTIHGDEEACRAIEVAVRDINARMSPAAMVVANADREFAYLSRVANMGGRHGIWEGDDEGGAESAELVSALRSLADANSVGAALVNEKGVSDAVRDNATEVEKVAAVCADLGLTIDPTAFAFEIPEEGGEADAASEQVREPAESSVPAGFKDAGNGLAYRFVDDEHCDYLRCTQLELFAYGSCPQSVYVQANVVDASDTIHGMTNDLLGPMRAGDRAIATLTVTEDAATGVELTEVTCH